MDPEPSAPVESSTPEPAAAPKAAAAGALPISVLILGFVVVVLLGVLVAIGLRPKNEEAAAEDPALRDLKGYVNAQKESINQERMKMGLSPLYTGGSQEPAEVIAKRITEDTATLVGMSKGGMDLIADKEAERAKTAKELSDALQVQTLLREKNSEMQKERDQALLEASTATLARKDLEKANATIALLQKEIERMGKGTGDTLQVVMERDRLRAQVADLQARLSKSSLFAGTESQLFAEAVELFRSLRQLENRPESEIIQAYSQYQGKYGATPFGRLQFPTGSSQLDPSDVERVQRFAAEAADNAMIIIIGYASETGNVDDNRTLSSDRATAVAQVVDAIKKPGQRVQAAYLGQTDRFGLAPELNQVCEVWQIMPKPSPPAPGE